MQLTEDQRIKLREPLADALFSAFPRAADLTRLVSGLGETLEGITSGGNLHDKIFEVVEWADAQGRLTELIDAAWIRNPGNDLFQEFIERLPARTGFLRDYAYDVFVSYANDVPDDWIKRLTRELSASLVRTLQRPVATAKSSRETADNAPPTDETLTKLREAATLVIVISKGYQNSEKCRQELASFLDAHPIDDVVKRRVLLVEYMKPDTTELPASIQLLRGFRFWDDRETFQCHVCDLSKSHVETLRRIALGREEDLPTESDFERTVFLAEVSEDLEPQREDVKRYLTQADLIVMPRTRYRNGSKEFQEDLDKDLAQCKLFVQLLSVDPGSASTHLPEDYVKLQHDRAVAAQRDILQWRTTDLKVSEVKDSAHRKLLEGRTVLADGFEEFKRAVVDRMRPNKTPNKTEFTDAFVFVNADSADRRWVQNVVVDSLERNGIGCALPLESAEPSKVREYLEVSLLNCDVLLVVYGTSTPGWVLSQLMQCRKILPQREQPLRALAIYDGPPPGKDELTVTLPNLRRLDCRTDEVELRQFLESLQA